MREPRPRAQAAWHRAVRAGEQEAVIPNMQISSVCFPVYHLSGDCSAFSFLTEGLILHMKLRRLIQLPYMWSLVRNVTPPPIPATVSPQIQEVYITHLSFLPCICILTQMHLDWGQKFIKTIQSLQDVSWETRSTAFPTPRHCRALGCFAHRPRTHTAVSATGPDTGLLSHLHLNIHYFTSIHFIAPINHNNQMIRALNLYICLQNHVVYFIILHKGVLITTTHSPPYLWSLPHFGQVSSWIVFHSVMIEWIL